MQLKIKKNKARLKKTFSIIKQIQKNNPEDIDMRYFPLLKGYIALIQHYFYEYPSKFLQTNDKEIVISSIFMNERWISEKMSYINSIINRDRIDFYDLDFIQQVIDLTIDDVELLLFDMRN